MEKMKKSFSGAEVVKSGMYELSSATCEPICQRNTAALLHKHAGILQVCVFLSCLCSVKRGFIVQNA